MRLFIAVEVPYEIKMKLSRLWVDIPGVRWVPVDQIHLTLAFLGEVEEATTELLMEKLARIQAPVFNLYFNQLGCFPDRRRPRVLWIGLKPEPHLRDLASRIHEAVIACDISQDERPFFPHVTLARYKESSHQKLDAFFDEYKKPRLPTIPVREFTLFQSRLTSQGVEHTPLRNFILTTSSINREYYPTESLQT